MKLNVQRLALAVAIMWGAGMLIAMLGNLIWPPYGTAFLQAMASVYPGYVGEPRVNQIVIGTVYALIDGAIGGPRWPGCTTSCRASRSLHVAPRRLAHV